MKVLITGAYGFVGKNLQQHLAERHDIEVVTFTRVNTLNDLPHLLEDVEFVFHLAGANRPKDIQDFVTDNTNFTVSLVHAVEVEMSSRNSNISIVFTSSIQASQDNHYGSSKALAEDVLFDFTKRTGAATHIFRLPNVFGKWSRPNYNSFVATFCHNIARGIPIQINNPSASVTLVYVDDVVQRFIQLMDGVHTPKDFYGFVDLSPQYTTTVGEVACQLEAFREKRDSLETHRVGNGFLRALYATYLSYLPPESFSFCLPMYGDNRGVFVEMLKTPDCGQFSFFTAHAGITRGGHYHHSKNEMFLVIKGEARFRFRQMCTGEHYELKTTGTNPQIVQTVPGWTHDITNIGSDELVVMLWANEVFNRSKPDTYACPL